MRYLALLAIALSACAIEGPTPLEGIYEGDNAYPYPEGLRQVRWTLTITSLTKRQGDCGGLFCEEIEEPHGTWRIAGIDDGAISGTYNAGDLLLTFEQKPGGHCSYDVRLTKSEDGFFGSYDGRCSDFLEGPLTLNRK